MILAGEVKLENQSPTREASRSLYLAFIGEFVLGMLFVTFGIFVLFLLIVIPDASAIAVLLNFYFSCLSRGLSSCNGLTYVDETFTFVTGTFTLFVTRLIGMKFDDFAKTTFDC